MDLYICCKGLSTFFVIVLFYVIHGGLLLWWLLFYLVVSWKVLFQLSAAFLHYTSMPLFIVVHSCYSVNYFGLVVFCV